MRLDHYITDSIINESIEDKGILKAVMMAGQAGAGKSYVISKIKSGQIEPRIVNVDTWIEFLHAEYDTPKHDRSRVLTMSQLYLFINSLLPLWIDSTSTQQTSVIRKYNLLENLGYDIAMVWIDVPLSTSLKRVEARNKEGKRIVPLDVAREYYYKAQKTKEFLQTKFHEFYEINNDDGMLTDEVILRSFKKTVGFFNAPLKNPIGIEIINTMKKNGYKYLADMYPEQVIKSKVRDWYSK